MGEWRKRKARTTREQQSLVGHLNHACKAINQADASYDVSSDWPCSDASSIVAKELLLIVVATANWSPGWKGLSILYRCDNQAGPTTIVLSPKGASQSCSNLLAMDLQLLESLAQDLDNNSLAPSTKRDYASGQIRYLEFCRANNLTLFPIRGPVVYICSPPVNEGLQYLSIKGFLSAICRLHVVLGLGDPLISSWPLLEYALHGVKLCQAKFRDIRAKKRLQVTSGILNKLRFFWSSENSKLIILC